MTAKLNHKQNWLFYYQGFLSVGVIFFFFTRLDAFLVVKQLLTSPIGWMLPYFFLVVPLFFREKKKYPPNTMLCWCLGYFIITFTSYALFPQSQISQQSLMDRSLSAVFLLATTFLFAEKQIQLWVRCALIAATIISTFNNFYQLLIDPSAFGGLVEGRAAGTYLDPNDCSNALILGLILTIDLLPQKFRFPWMLFVGFGVILTFSRGGILGWVLVVIMMSLIRVISPQKILLGLLSVVTLLFISAQLGAELSGGGPNIYTQLDSVALERVEGMIKGENVAEDASTLERKGIATKGWEMFLERPIFGYGVGATFDYGITGFSVSTHNTFLLYAAEYGVIGIPILPLAILAAVYHARGRTHKIGLIFAVFILFVSLFSHTILAANYYLIPFALISGMSESSRSWSIETDELRKYKVSKLPGSMRISD